MATPVHSAISQQPRGPPPQPNPGRARPRGDGAQTDPQGHLAIDRAPLWAVHTHTHTHTHTCTDTYMHRASRPLLTLTLCERAAREARVRPHPHPGVQFSRRVEGMWAQGTARLRGQECPNRPTPGPVGQESHPLWSLRPRGGRHQGSCRKIIKSSAVEIMGGFECIYL